MATYFIDGRMTADAEAKSTKDGKHYYKLVIAWNRGKNKPAHFYTCTLDNDRGQKLITHLRKGTYLVITGEPDWYEYEKKTYEVIRIEKLSFAGGSEEKKQDNPERLPYKEGDKYFATRQELEEYQKSIGKAKEPFDDSDIPF